MCVRQADNDGKHSYDERIVALTLLCEIWMTYTDFIDTKGDLKETALGMLKRGARDRHRPVRLVSVILLFKVLDKFSELKNSAAPALYKSLIFSLIESPNESTTRELYLLNFSTLFETHPTIPVSLLMDPLIKQI